MIKYKPKFSSLTLYTSESCNLQCSYCDMAKHINYKLHTEEALRVKKSLINGQYLNTLLKALERIGQNPGDIVNIELWGQEPTLTLKEFQIFFKEFYQYFYNINRILFSTNGVAFIDEIVNFAQLVDELAIKPINLVIQFSYDGAKATQEDRGINPNIIINNIEETIMTLSKIQLINTKIDIQFHNVISRNIINNYNTEEILQNYWVEFHKLYEKFSNKNTNKNINIHPFSPSFEVPFNATVEEGKRVCEFYIKSTKTCQQYDIKLWEGLLYQLYMNGGGNKFFNSIQLFKEIPILENNKQDILKIASESLGCGYGYSTLKIRYDGTLLHCQNALLGLTEQELENQEGAYYQIQKRKLSKHFYPNLLTDSDDVLNQYFYLAKLRVEEGFTQTFCSTYNLMSLLLKSKQINEKYNNPFEMIKAAFFISYTECCPHNSMMVGGSVLNKYCGWIRFLCNGLMDLAFEHMDSPQRSQMNGN